MAVKYEDDALKLLIEGLLRGFKQTVRTLESVLEYVNDHAVIIGRVEETLNKD